MLDVQKKYDLMDGLDGRNVTTSIRVSYNT